MDVKEMDACMSKWNNVANNEKNCIWESISLRWTRPPDLTFYSPNIRRGESLVIMVDCGTGAGRFLFFSGC